MDVRELAAKFEIGGNITEIEEIKAGHINVTYRVATDGEDDYVLQKINRGVFNDPRKLMENLYSVTAFLGKKIAASGGDPKRQTLTLIPLKNRSGKEAAAGGCLLEEAGGFYRINTPLHRFSPEM